MDNPSFELLRWSEEAGQLMKNASKELSKSPSEKVRKLATKIPLSLSKDDDPISIVFAGQYNAGKSSILSVLTGRNDIPIGGDITTQETTSYPWNGVEIFDSPGIHTSLRPDHDKITYDAISRADLLVFVITNELFDSHIGNNFRKLAFEKSKAHEMMLIVNKMQRHRLGNSEEARQIVRNGIKEVLHPRTPEDFYCVCTDAKSALLAKTESDTDYSEALVAKSGLTDLNKTLNRFLAEKGLTAKLTTPLYALEQILLEALAGESTGDLDVDGLEEILLQKRRALLEAKERLPKAIDVEVERTTRLIKAEGRSISELIHGKADKDDIDSRLQSGQLAVEKYTSDLGSAIERVIGQHMSDLESVLQGIADSELARELLPRLISRMKEAEISQQATDNLKKGADISNRFGEFLIKNSFKVDFRTFSANFSRLRY